MSELDNSKRRLHAKLFAWEADGGIGWLVGSANFTTAAFDARNIEVCLMVANVQAEIESLFDTDLHKRPLRVEDFEPGSEEEPVANDEVSLGLKLISALLLERLTIPCSCNRNVRTSHEHLPPSRPATPRRSRPAAPRPSAPSTTAGST